MREPHQAPRRPRHARIDNQARRLPERRVQPLGLRRVVYAHPNQAVAPLPDLGLGALEDRGDPPAGGLDDLVAREAFRRHESQCGTAVVGVEGGAEAGVASAARVVGGRNGGVVAGHGSLGRGTLWRKGLGRGSRLERGGR